jgi:hypothetical protein
MDYAARPRCPSRDWRLAVAGRFLDDGGGDAAAAVLVATPASVSLFAIEELGGGEDRLVPVCRLETLARVVALARVRGEGGRDLGAVLFENGRLALLRYEDLECAPRLCPSTCNSTALTNLLNHFLPPRRSRRRRALSLPQAARRGRGRCAAGRPRRPGGRARGALGRAPPRGALARRRARGA